MAIVVSGKDLSQELKDAMKEEIVNLKKVNGREPHLVVILVGNNPSSISYVTGKEKACDYVGIKNTTIKLDENISEEELVNVIKELNKLGIKKIAAYDPVAIEEFKKKYTDIEVTYMDSAKAVYEAADGVAIVTAWNEFKQVATMGEKPIFDLRYMFSNINA